jgi:hypothetical protein
MEEIQKWAAIIALIFVTLILGSAVLAIWRQSSAVNDLLALAELVLSWPVAAGGLVFGGGQAIIRAWKPK